MVSVVIGVVVGGMVGSAIVLILTEILGWW